MVVRTKKSFENNGVEVIAYNNDTLWLKSILKKDKVI